MVSWTDPFYDRAVGTLPAGEMFLSTVFRAVRQHPRSKTMLNYKRNFSPLLVKKRCIRKNMKVLMRLRKVWARCCNNSDRYTDRAIQTTRKVFAFLGKPVGITQEMVDLTANHRAGTFYCNYCSQLLVNKHIQELMSDETMKTMWLWHAIEENEHKAVAYDVFEGVFERESNPIYYERDHWLQPWPFYSACSRILYFVYYSKINN